MKITRKLVPKTQDNRESLVMSIITTRFPEFLDAFEAVDDKLECDEELDQSFVLDPEKWDDNLERELQAIVAPDWTERSGITASQRETLVAALKLAGDLKAMHVDQLKSRYKGCNKHSKFVAQFNDYLGLARRAHRTEVLEEPVRPELFLNWAKANGIEYKAALGDAVVTYHRKNAWLDGSEATQEVAGLREKVQKLEAELAEANKKPKPTLYRIIYLLAAARHKSASLTDEDISKIVTFIRDKAPLHGFRPPDDESVRDCLREVKEYVTRTVARSPSPL